MLLIVLTRASWRRTGSRTSGANTQQRSQFIRIDIVSLGEAYNYAKAREDRILNDSRRNTGALGSATGRQCGRLRSRERWPDYRAFAVICSWVARCSDVQQLRQRMRLVALPDSTKENGLNDRLTKAGESALTGALVGGALPIGFAAAKGVVSPSFPTSLPRSILPKAWRVVRSRGRL